MPDQDGGKLATVRQDDGDEFYHVTMGGNIGRPLILFSSRHESLANNFCDNVNTAHQAALTAERKRVLEMVFDLDGFKPTLHEMFGVAHDNPEMAEAYQRVGKVADGIRGQLKIEIRALLSRLEGEEER